MTETAVRRAPKRKRRKLKFHLSKLPRPIGKLKPIEIADEIRRLSIRRRSDPVGTPNSDGWYKNRDGTLTRWHAIGAALQEGRTVADHIVLMRLEDLERATPETF